MTSGCAADDHSQPTSLVTRPLRTLETPWGALPSFIGDQEANIDPDTVAAFGHEWSQFGEFTDEEIAQGGDEYFADLIPAGQLTGARVLDVGCGSGRWTKYLAARAAFVEAVDPSAAVVVAAKTLADCRNVRVLHAGVGSLPFPPASFDLVTSVGVLHHVPDTFAAIRRLAELVRPGGLLYLYLYYRLDGRPWPYRMAFHGSRVLRAIISRLPSTARSLAADVVAVGIYWPFVNLARTVRRFAPAARLHQSIPLSYYVDKPWKIIRNDALDRLGTPLEQRFSRAQIVDMLTRAGLETPTFGEAMPRWRVVATRPVR